LKIDLYENWYNWSAVVALILLLAIAFYNCMLDIFCIFSIYHDVLTFKLFSHQETVSSAEIAAKTKSVIELKKLQLLQLQRRVRRYYDTKIFHYCWCFRARKNFDGITVLSRSDFLNDFFKPIKADMTRIKSFKKSRHGRRIKQLEKIEQKMKEERQKRIRERQKDFFGAVEAHRLAYLSVDI
jgi:hypothetical protein